MEFPPAQEHCAQIMSEIFGLLKNRSLCDTKIIVEEEEFWAHRCVLVAASTTLHEIIIQESPNSRDSTIQLTLQGLSAGGFRALLSYIYTGEPPKNTNMKATEDFRKACCALGIPSRPTATEKETIGTVKQEVGEEMDVELVVEVTTCRQFEQGATYDEIADTMEDGDSQADDANAEDGSPPSEKNKTGSGRTSTRRKRKSARVSLPDFVGYSDDEEDDDDGFDEPAQDQEKNDPSSKENTTPTIANGQPTNQVCIKEEFVEGFPRLKRERKRLNPRKVPRKRLSQRGRPRAANDGIFPHFPPYNCPHEGCKKICENRMQLKKHYRNHSEKTHACDTCGRSFLYPKDLVVHLRTHTGEKPYKCDECGASFAQNSTLKNHLVSHLKVRDHICDVCGRAYSAKRSLLLHKSEKHSDKTKNYRCIHCGKVSESRSTHLLHVRTDCNSACFLCHKCGRKYRREDPYKAHQEKCTGVINFQCEYCKRNFKSDKNLQNHVRSFHTKKSDVPDPEVPDAPETVAEEPSAPTDAVAAAVSAVGGVAPPEEGEAQISDDIIMTEMILVNMGPKDEQETVICR